MSKEKILALCGGVGGAKLALGLSKTLSPDEVSFVVNTGDDFNFLGLHISPDIDTVCYTLAGISNQSQGWGIENESWSFMERQKALGLESWFMLGDKDLATHIFRTKQLNNGKTLSDVTAELISRHNIQHKIFPMSDDAVRTQVKANIDGKTTLLDFQEYFVKYQCKPVVESIYFDGIENAKTSEGFLSALDDPDLDTILLCPSNPYLSIDPIIHIPGIREKLKNHSAKVIAVSPLISGKAVKGPTAKIMNELNIPLSNLSIAKHYQDFLNTLIIDSTDEKDLPAIEKLGINAFSCNTFMQNEQDKIELAKKIVGLI